MAPEPFPQTWCMIFRGIVPIIVCKVVTKLYLLNIVRLTNINLELVVFNIRKYNRGNIPQILFTKYAEAQVQKIIGV